MDAQWRFNPIPLGGILFITMIVNHVTPPRWNRINKKKMFWANIGSWLQVKILGTAISAHILSPCVHNPCQKAINHQHLFTHVSQIFWISYVKMESSWKRLQIILRLHIWSLTIKQWIIIQFFNDFFGILWGKKNISYFLILDFCHKRGLISGSTHSVTVRP